MCVRKIGVTARPHEDRLVTQASVEGNLFKDKTVSEAAEGLGESAYAFHRWASSDDACSSEK